MRLLLIGLLFAFVCRVKPTPPRLAGQQIQPGGKIEIRFPVSKYFQDIASQGGNPRPEMGRAVLAFPGGFDPSRPWPILIVTSTSDFNRTSAMDVDWYRSARHRGGLGRSWPGRHHSPADRFHSMAAWNFGGGARNDSQRMAAVIEMARRFRRILGRLETERRPGPDAGEERFGPRLRIFPERDQRRPPQRRLQDLPAGPRFSRGAGLAEQRRQRYASPRRKLTTWSKPPWNGPDSNACGSSNSAAATS